MLATKVSYGVYSLISLMTSNTLTLILSTYFNDLTEHRTLLFALRANSDRPGDFVYRTMIRAILAWRKSENDKYSSL